MSATDNCGDGCNGCRNCWSGPNDAPPEQQNPDGSWSPAEPLPFFGWKARTEQWLRRRGYVRLPNLLAAWDERGLGR